MLFSMRPYVGLADLYRIQAATAEWIALAGFRGYVNPGDIALRLLNGQGHYAPETIVRLWENAQDLLVGWAMVYPAWNSYEVLLHPDYRQHPLVTEMLDWAEREVIRWLLTGGNEVRTIQLDVFDGDMARITLLEHRGYSRGDQHGVISVCPFDRLSPLPQLPVGFAIRHLQGEEDADKLVALVNDSFGWHWTADGYRSVIRSPGYHVENELVVVAADGRFVASCILLPDTRNRTVMFENVCTHSDFRRLGLARALLVAGMQEVKAQGFSAAMVPHAAGLGAAQALYTSAGFQPAYNLYHYHKVAFAL